MTNVFKNEKKRNDYTVNIHRQMRSRVKHAIKNNNKKYMIV